MLLKNKPRTFDGAVMYGIGHGGLESALLVGGMAAAGMVNALVLPGLDPHSMGLPPDQVEQIVAAREQIASMPPWLPLLGAFERVFALCVQICCSVLVVQCFVRGGLRWLWIAVGYHFAVDLAAVFGARALTDILGETAGMVAVEGVVAAFAAISLVIVFRLAPEGPASERERAAPR